jgi:hypothetical protein
MDAEAQPYSYWHDAFDRRNLPQAIKLGEAYLQQYPTGKFAGYITKIIEFARISLSEEKIKSLSEVDTGFSHKGCRAT